MGFDFLAPVGAFWTIAMLVQLGFFILLVIILFDLRNFLREGTRLMRRVDRFLSRKEHSD